MGNAKEKCMNFLYAVLALLAVPALTLCVVLYICFGGGKQATEPVHKE